MKKIPTLFERVYGDNKIIDILPNTTQGMERILEEGIATRKYDGTCCMVQDGKIYARFDYKQGRKLPNGAIPCQEKADEITGHFPHWVEVKDQPQYKYHKIAFDKYKDLSDGTYELCGKHFQKNIDKLCDKGDVLVPHGKDIIEVERTFEGIREYLKDNYIEGIVFWIDGKPKCKIKRSDFGFEWGKGR